MNLEEQIKNDMTAALRAGSKFELDTLRTVFAQIKDERIRLRPKRELVEEDVVAVLLSAEKKRKEAIELYKQGNRPDLVDKEEKEIVIIRKYLPEQLSEESIREIIDDLIRQAGASSIKELGKVMGLAMTQLKGKADGKIVQNMVRDRLNQLS
jgi:uncharacterized protein YqeY